MLFFTFVLNSQETEKFATIKTLRRSISLGSGFGINKYVTYWAFKPEGSSEKVYPAHKFIRQGAFFDFESRSVWTYKRMHVDFGYNVFFGFAGDTRETGISEKEEIISDGGHVYGFGIFYKLAFPFIISSEKLITPYTGLYVQGAFFSSNGKGVSKNIDAMFNYKKSWNEGVIGATFPIGLEYEMKKVVLFTVYRFMYIGVSFTDWNPAGSPVIEDSRPVMNDFQVGILYKI